MNPDAMPIKHTALGRFRHEGAETTIASDSRLVMYSGDDNRFDYQYKWVSAERVTEENSHFGSTLLSEGTLYVAKFHADGVIEWMPLVHVEGPLTAENGFNSQADIAIDTRLAATTPPRAAPGRSCSCAATRRSRTWAPCGTR